MNLPSLSVENASELLRGVVSTDLFKHARTCSVKNVTTNVLKIRTKLPQYITSDNRHTHSIEITARSLDLPKPAGDDWFAIGKALAPRLHEAIGCPQLKSNNHIVTLLRDVLADQHVVRVFIGYAIEEPQLEVHAA